MCKSLHLAIVVVGTLVGAVLPVCADEDNGAEAEEARQRGIAAHKEAADSGDSQYQVEKFKEAADAFAEAYRLRPSFKLLFNIGQDNAGAKRYGLAMEAFERYLSDGGDEIELARSEEVKKEIERLKNLVGYLDVKAPAGATLYVDDTPIGIAPMPGKKYVSSARRQTVRAEQGGRKMEKSFTVLAGQTESIDFTALGKAPTLDGAVRDRPPSKSAPSDKRLRLIQTIGWGCAGLGAGALIAGAITGGLALNHDADLTEDCDGNVCYSKDYPQLDSRDNLARSSTALLAVGGATAAVGAGLLIYVKIKKSKSERITLMPTPSGLLLQGRF